MRHEILTAVNFLKSFLFNNLPRLRVEAFGDAVAALLMVKLGPHWHPDQPCRDVQYRCMRVTGPNADSIFSQAAQQSGLFWQEIVSCLPQEELCMWIDPGEVTARIGSRGETIQLLQGSGESLSVRTPLEIHSVYQLGIHTDNGTLDYPLNDRSTSSNSSCSPSISPTALLGGGSKNYCSSYEQSNKRQSLGPMTSLPNYFTAASFAQTKFGSTKLRSPNKTCSQSVQNPNRHSLLSLPTDPAKSGGMYGQSLLSRPVNLPVSSESMWLNKNVQQQKSPLQIPQHLNAVSPFLSSTSGSSLLSDTHPSSMNDTSFDGLQCFQSLTRFSHKSCETAQWLSYLKVPNDISPMWSASLYEEQSLKLSSTNRVVTPLLGYQTGGEEVN